MRIAAAFILVGSLVAGDWPQWRGANRDGVSTAATPASWPEKLNQTWKITVGEGHASPISAAGRIYVFAREGDQEVVRAIDAATGQTRWEQRYAAPYTMNMAATAHGKGPKSTPLFYADKLYTFGISGILTCFEAGSGRVLWRNNFGGRFKHTSPAFGSAMSPVADNGLLIVHAGGDGEGALTAFDPQSGAMKWTWTGDGPAYASPLVAEIAGKRQIVTQSQRHIIGVAAASGELLWKIPYRTNFEQNAITPVVYKDLLILSGLDNGIMTIRVSQVGNAWRTERVWDNAQTPMYMSTPVLAGDLLFGFTHKNKGQFVCLDARNGQTLWSGPPRQGENAAIVRDGDHLFLLKNEGELIVARAGGKAFEPLRVYTVADSPTWAHPLLLDDGVVIKDKTTVARWTWK